MFVKFYCSENIGQSKETKEVCLGQVAKYCMASMYEWIGLPLVDMYQ